MTVYIGILQIWYALPVIKNLFKKSMGMFWVYLGSVDIYSAPSDTKLIVVTGLHLRAVKCQQVLATQIASKIVWINLKHTFGYGARSVIRRSDGMNKARSKRHTEFVDQQETTQKGY